MFINYCYLHIVFFKIRFHSYRQFKRGHIYRNKRKQTYQSTRKQTKTEKKGMRGFGKLIDKTKHGTGEDGAKKEAGGRTKDLNDRLAGRKAGSIVSNVTKEFLVRGLVEVAMLVAYFSFTIITCIIIVLLIEPLIQLETWLTTFIENGSASYADRIVELEHSQLRLEPFSDKIGNGIFGGIVFFLFFFVRRFLKGHWLHQE